MAGYLNEYEQEITTEDGFVYRVKRRAEAPNPQFIEPKRVVEKAKPKVIEKNSRRKLRLPKIKSSGMQLSVDISSLQYEIRQAKFIEDITAQINELIDGRFADFNVEATALHRLVSTCHEKIGQAAKQHLIKMQAHAGEAARMAQELEQIKAKDGLMDTCFNYNSENLATQEEAAVVEELYTKGVNKLKLFESEPNLSVPDPAPLKYEFPLEFEMCEAVKRLVDKNAQENFLTLMEGERHYRLLKERATERQAAHLSNLEGNWVWGEDARDLICLK
mmetsp:Transcript_9534/g.18515  ORF Transcript_9534/g.18515 Transcript_9534/m.18515 type:complete len:276 (+) Transcript_9534:5089-5916(+)